MNLKTCQSVANGNESVVTLLCITPRGATVLGGIQMHRCCTCTHMLLSVFAHVLSILKTHCHAPCQTAHIERPACFELDGVATHHAVTVLTLDVTRDTGKSNVMHGQQNTFGLINTLIKLPGHMIQSHQIRGMRLCEAALSLFRLSVATQTWSQKLTHAHEYS